MAVLESWRWAGESAGQEEEKLEDRKVVKWTHNLQGLKYKKQLTRIVSLSGCRIWDANDLLTCM